MSFQGLSGHDFVIMASPQGLVDHPRRSANRGDSRGPTDIRYPLYLSPPAVADLEESMPAEVSVTARYVAPDEASRCAPGGVEEGPAVEISTDISGTYLVECRRRGEPGDGPADVLRTGQIAPGSERIPLGVAPEAPMQCEVVVLLGELHYIAEDIETVFPGLRLFELLSDGSRRGLAMRWDDRLVDGTRLLADGDESLVATGVRAVDSGRYDAPAVAASVEVPGGNARAWGQFDALGLGNEAYLDTYTLLDSSAPVIVDIPVAGPCLEPGEGADAGGFDAGPADGMWVDAGSDAAGPPGGAHDLGSEAPDVGYRDAGGSEMLLLSGGGCRHHPGGRPPARRLAWIGIALAAAAVARHARTT
jgi:hypothetical protein